MTSCSCKFDDTHPLRSPSMGPFPRTLENHSTQATGIHSSHDAHPTHEALSELFGVSVTLSPWRSIGGIQYTPRWRHQGGRGYLSSMRGHLVTVCHSGWGMVILSAGGRRTAGRLRRGAVTIFPEGTQGQFDVTGESECSQVIVPSSMLADCGLEAGLTESTALVQRTTVLDPVLFQLIDMLTACSQGEASGDQFREQCAALICTQLLRKHTSCVTNNLHGSATGLASWQLRRIKDYMQKNLHLPLTLHDVAKEVDLSRHYLCTAFRTATGFTPHEYLTTIRMERAKELLVASNLTITDISSSVGYRTASAFTARFRQATGVTPRTFRSSC